MEEEDIPDDLASDYDRPNIEYSQPIQAPMQPQAPPPMPLPFSTADEFVLRDHTNALSEVSRLQSSGELSAEHAAQYENHILGTMQPLLARQQQDQQRKEQQAIQQAMKATAQEEAIRALHRKARANSFGQEVVERVRPLDGAHGEFVQDKDGNWKPLEYPEHDAKKKRDMEWIKNMVASAGGRDDGTVTDAPGLLEEEQGAQGPDLWRQGAQPIPFKSDIQGPPEPPPEAPEDQAPLSQAAPPPAGGMSPAAKAYEGQSVKLGKENVGGDWFTRADKTEAQKKVAQLYREGKAVPLDDYAEAMSDWNKQLAGDRMKAGLRPGAPVVRNIGGELLNAEGQPVGRPQPQRPAPNPHMPNDAQINEYKRQAELAIGPVRLTGDRRLDSSLQLDHAKRVNAQTNHLISKHIEQEMFKTAMAMKTSESQRKEGTRAEQHLIDAQLKEHLNGKRIDKIASLEPDQKQFFDKDGHMGPFPWEKVEKEAVAAANAEFHGQGPKTGAHLKEEEKKASDAWETRRLQHLSYSQNMYKYAKEAHAADFIGDDKSPEGQQLRAGATEAKKRGDNFSLHAFRNLDEVRKMGGMERFQQIASPQEKALVAKDVEHIAKKYPQALGQKPVEAAPAVNPLPVTTEDRKKKLAEVVGKAATAATPPGAKKDERRFRGVGEY